MTDASAQPGVMSSDISVIERHESARLDALDMLHEQRRGSRDGMEDAAFCAICHQEIADEPVESDDELLHHSCWAQRANAEDLRDAVASAAATLAEAVWEYQWERSHGSSKGATESKQDKTSALVAEYVTEILRGKPEHKEASAKLLLLTVRLAP